MAVLLLGPVEITADRQVTGIPQLAQRVVLAMLAAAGNRVVPVATLIDALWQEEVSRRRIKNLHAHIYQLRRRLSDLGDRPGAVQIVTQPPGYRLVLADGGLDVDVFSRLVGEARGALAAGDHDRSRELYRQALSLWRGPALADVVEAAPQLRGLAEQFEMERLTAVQERITADLAGGMDAELLVELTELVARYPLQERLRCQLMLCLYRCGRQADALATYHDARRTLRDELGLDPGPELRELHQRILTGEPVRQGHLANKPARTVIPRQLPPRITRFVGRESELETLTRLLRESTRGGKGVTILAIGGSAGVGKSALALWWAHEIADGFPDGQLYVNLRGFGPSGTPVTPEQAVRGFLDALDIGAERIPVDPDAQVGLYRSLVARRRLLIVLDNVRDADQVRPLLPAGPNCAVVVTSRNHLIGLGATDGAHLLTLDVFSDAEARELLRQRLSARRVSDEPGAAAELIGLCARLPLALATVLARADVRPERSLAAMIEELRAEPARLDAFDAADEMASVRAVFSWSYRQLSTSAARMFQLLAIHPGPDITVAAAASLAGITVPGARAALDELSGSNLLTECAAGRFSFHDLLRAYAAERAHDQHSDSARRAATNRVLDHYLHTAHAAAVLLNPARDPIPLGPPCAGATPEDIRAPGPALSWCQAEYRVLLAVISLAAEEGFDAHAWQLPWSLVNFFDRRGYWHDWVVTHRTGLAAAQRLGDRFGEANACQNLGIVHEVLGRHEVACNQLRYALDLYQQLGLPEARARCHLDLARAYEGLNRYIDALDHARAAIDLYELAGNRAGKARALNAMGWSRAHLDDAGEAITYCVRSLRIHQKLGNRLGQAAAWDSLAFAHTELGDHDQAAACSMQALSLLRDLGCHYQYASALTQFGHTCLAAGDAAAACDKWREALGIFAELNHPDADKVRELLTSALAPVPVRLEC
jgi:DNA-binding SARP family transcriptional activator